MFLFAEVDGWSRGDISAAADIWSINLRHYPPQQRAESLGFFAICIAV
jgi:hypothetical protein